MLFRIDFSLNKMYEKNLLINPKLKARESSSLYPIEQKLTPETKFNIKVAAAVGQSSEFMLFRLRRR